MMSPRLIEGGNSGVPAEVFAGEIVAGEGRRQNSFPNGTAHVGKFSTASVARVGAAGAAGAKADADKLALAIGASAR
jgi:hypothetical protein